jgi:hypothetical protein
MLHISLVSDFAVLEGTPAAKLRPHIGWKLGA